MVKNSVSPFLGLIQHYWMLMSNVVLAAAIVLTAAQWFGLKISSNTADLLLILAFIMYLVSEKIVGRPLRSGEKAFCYFGSYVLFLFILERNVVAAISWVFSLIATGLVIYQGFYFRRSARSLIDRRLVMIFGLVALGCIASILLTINRRI